MFELMDEISNYDNKVEYIYDEIGWDIPCDYQVVASFSDILNENISLSENNLRIVSIIPCKYFIHDVMKYYSNDTYLEKQFLLDISRSNLKINGNIVESPRNAVN